MTKLDQKNEQFCHQFKQVIINQIKMESDFFALIDFLGTAAFSISGVFGAMKKKLDIFGTFTIAFVTAIAGGTLRDAIIGDFPVTWLRSNTYIIVIFLSATIALFTFKSIKDPGRLLLEFDSIGLGFFTVLGIHKGIEFSFSAGWCIALGALTACFGGMIRDSVLNQMPHIFHKQIYATACIFGGILYFILLKTTIPEVLVVAICISLIILVRLIALKYNWNLAGIFQFHKKN
jgi:uncharacterized membrane protein YeiH